MIDVMAQQPLPTEPLDAGTGISGIDVAWSAFAPELVVAGMALALLLLAVARLNRTVLVVTLGLGTVALGVWLATQDHQVPAAVVVALGVLGTGAALGLRDHPALAQTWLAALAAGGALALTAWQWTEVMTVDAGEVGESVRQASIVVGGSIAVDGLAFYARLIVYASVLAVLPIGYGYLQERGIHRPDVEPLVLLSATGMALLAAAADLIMLFVALELLSIALYVLAGLARRDRRSQEAAVKYLVLGAVASAILLYGMALVYVATGTLEIGQIGDALGLVTTPERVALLGVGLMTVGLGFKVALVPFHLWTPDVYQGAPTNVTAFMAAATKAAAFAALLRVYGVGFDRLADLWAPILAVLAAVTMMVGAVLAVVQHDVKRLLAYSSVAHAGYAAIGLVAGGAAGRSATLWYLLTYAVTVLGAFGAVIAVERRRRGEVVIDDLRGLGRRSPVVAGLLALALLSLAGIPPTAGFAGKWVVFGAGIAAGWTWLVVVGVVSTVVAAFFYVRLLAAMYLEDAADDAPAPVVTPGLSVGVAAASAATIVLGIIPATFLDLAEQASLLAR